MIHYNDTARDYIKRNKEAIEEPIEVYTFRDKLMANMFSIVLGLWLVILFGLFILGFDNAIDVLWRNEYVNVPR